MYNADEERRIRYPMKRYRKSTVQAQSVVKKGNSVGRTADAAAADSAFRVASGYGGLGCSSWTVTISQKTVLWCQESVQKIFQLVSVAVV